MEKNRQSEINSERETKEERRTSTLEGGKEFVTSFDKSLLLSTEFDFSLGSSLFSN